MTLSRRTFVQATAAGPLFATAPALFAQAAFDTERWGPIVKAIGFTAES